MLGRGGVSHQDWGRGEWMLGFFIALRPERSEGRGGFRVSEPGRQDLLLRWGLGA